MTALFPATTKRRIKAAVLAQIDTPDERARTAARTARLWAERRGAWGSDRQAHVAALVRAAILRRAAG